MSFIFESYKVQRNLEDNPRALGDRIVSVKDLVSTRIKRKNKRINDVLAIHQERIQRKDDIKLAGLEQVDESYMAPIMALNTHRKSLVWRAIKDFDSDKNGFLLAHELEGCFREHFAPELDGKSLVIFFRRWSTDHDKELVNYRKIKEFIEAKVAEFVPPSTESKRFSRDTGQEDIQEEQKEI